MLVGGLTTGGGKLPVFPFGGGGGPLGAMVLAGGGGGACVDVEFPQVLVPVAEAGGGARSPPTGGGRAPPLDRGPGTVGGGAVGLLPPTAIITTTKIHYRS